MEQKPNEAGKPTAEANEAKVDVPPAEKAAVDDIADVPDPDEDDLDDLDGMCSLRTLIHIHLEEGLACTDSLRYAR